MGDTKPGGAAEDARPAPPSLRKPGDPVPPGSSQRVQYPVPTKEQPIPAAPGSPADTSSTSSPDPLSADVPGISRTGRSSGTGSNPGSAPGSIPGTIPSDPQNPGYPATRVN